MARRDRHEATFKDEEARGILLGILCYRWASLSQLAKAKRLAYPRLNA
jgi:hypothetical protein